MHLSSYSRPPCGERRGEGMLFVRRTVRRSSGAEPDQHRSSRLFPPTLTYRAKPLAIVRQIKMAHVRSNGYYPGWINIALTVVTRLSFLQIEGLFNTRPLVQLTQIVAQIRIVLHAA